MKKFFSDFKKFATKGNVVDMAVGVVVGGAFSKIVTALVNNIITPLISLLTGGANFADLSVVLKAEVLDEAGEVIQEAVKLNYGAFLQAVIDFFIIALSIFTVIRIITKAQDKLGEKKRLEEEAKKAEEEAKKKAAEEEAKKNSPEVVLAEIRDILKDMKK
ncbi:MAG: large conductance mechanosensitive channel protein MscL [Ruminococcaceae bacterium]|nr:large conductance mechanosensitive channel protein MscL [Oscillospiraceae bacterium]